MIKRLNKFLAEAGIASRRHADKIISEGKVCVNGHVVQELGFKIDTEKDRVEMDGNRVERKKMDVYLMLNKPNGYLVTMKDSFDRPIANELLPDLNVRVFPVGRLDYESEGLLLFTNDGELANRLTHPSYKIRKTYLVRVKGEPEPSKLLKLKKGIYLDGRKTAQARITLIERNPKKSFLKVQLYEGRKREIRRMFEFIGHRVIFLKRIGLGGLTLGNLKSGKWRFLKKEEINGLKKQTKLT